MTSTSRSVASADIMRIKGVGPAMAEKLRALGISSVFDLLFHLPFRYEDRTRVQAINTLKHGSSAVVEGEIVSSSILFGKRRSLLCTIDDGSGTLALRFFHFSAAQKNNLAAGTTIRCFGEVSFSGGRLNMIHPEYTSRLHDNPKASSCLTAVYPSTEGIHQHRWRSFIQSAFELCTDQSLPDLIARDELHEAGLDTGKSLFEALRLLHFPPANIDIALLGNGMHPLQRRLAYEELIAQRISHLETKSHNRQEQAIAIEPAPALSKKFCHSLPFSLTNAQHKVLDDIYADIQKPAAMMRLLQGDVGSGKTVVAAITALQAVGNQLQAAVMAPTEILAEQHYHAFKDWLQPLGISVGLLVSKLPAAEKRTAYEEIANGDTAVVIGTHALLQKDVVFHNLGLIVIDEQHRFGVEQRSHLKNKREDGLSIHQLVMTATPIPRTLAMTFYADLDYSVIDELPPGRTAVQTVVIGNEKREQVIDRIRQACQQGRQVYWVCTLIEESEALECQAAESTATELAARLPGISVGLVHGRIKPAQKQAVMRAFKDRDVQLLVATTVIEVGVDVPNASLMVIENPERLGLAQLHQLRGRVGRGNIESHCVLLYKKPISKNGRQRLEIMRQTNSGFVLAEQDLKMRGPGDVLGTRQSGAVMMRLADLERDAELIDQVVKASDYIYQSDPERARALIRRWCPLSEKYTNV